MELSSRAFDLFLSHRGPDSKRFCGFLKEALYRAGVHAFVDGDDLRVGDAAWSTMQSALQSAQYLLPVISEGYVNSRWCLDELVLMMHTPEKVISLFLNVRPDKDNLTDLLVRCAALPDMHAFLVVDPAA